MIVLVLFVVLYLGVDVYRSMRQSRKNAAEGVIAHWEGLRITPTELIEGYQDTARRHALNGLTARVENSGTHRGNGNDNRQIHVIVEGPSTAIVKTKKVATINRGDELARKFAANLNMASRRLG